MTSTLLRLLLAQTESSAAPPESEPAASLNAGAPVRVRGSDAPNARRVDHDFEAELKGLPRYLVSVKSRWRLLGEHLSAWRAGGPLLLFGAALLLTSCLSPRQLPDRGASFRVVPHEALEASSGEGPRVATPRVPISGPASEARERLHRRRASRLEATAVKREGVERDARQGARVAQLAFHSALLDVSGSIRRISGGLSTLKASGHGIHGGTGVFVRYADYGTQQLRWMNEQLAAGTRLANAAFEMEDPDMQLALLRLAGPRLEAAMMGALLLTVWFDVLNFADAVLAQHLYSVEQMFVDLWRWQKMIEPSMAALSSIELGQVDAAAREVPVLVGHLSGELTETVRKVRRGAENVAKVLMLKDAIEALTLFSALKFSLPPATPTASSLAVVGLSVGGDGVMMGTRIVVSAEWVEMVRQLVRSGILSLPVVNAAVQVQAGQGLLAQAHEELPTGVREALGEGPEVRAMRATGREGAGMADPPRHHVMPREFREWFEKRGFVGEMDIDQFCVELPRAHHEALHGGGSWRLGRTWPDEWNQMIMSVLRQAEAKAGRTLTSSAVLRLVAREMRRYKIPMSFVPGRR